MEGDGTEDSQDIGHGACADDSNSRDIHEAVEGTMGQLLMDVEAGKDETTVSAMEVEIGTATVEVTSKVTESGTEDVPSDQTKVESGDTKMADGPDEKPREASSEKGKDGPIVIDLSDDEEEYSKENIEKTPAKSLKGLLKSLSLQQSADVLEKIKIAIANLPRDVLEDMLYAKIEENLEIEASLKKFEAKVTSFLLYKDRVTFKAQCLQGQLIDSAKAMATVSDQLTRHPKSTPLMACNPSPLKFQRTVGIQCRTDPLPRINKNPPLCNSRILNAPALSPSNGTKPGIPATKNGVIPTAVNNTSSPPQLTPNGTKRQSVDGVGRNQVQTDVPPKVARRAGPASVVRAAAEANNYVNHNVHTGEATIVLNGTGGVSQLNSVPKPLIDLASTNHQNVIVHQNGVQYRVVNPNTLQAGMQLTSNTGASYHLVPTTSASGQPASRRLMVQQKQTPNPNSGQQQQPILVLPPSMGTNRIGGQVRPNNLAPHSTRPLGPTRTQVANPAIVARTQGSQRQGSITSLPLFILPELPPMSPQPRKPKDPPPRPVLTLQEQGGGIVLSWTHISSAIYAEIQSYQIFACQEPIAGAGKPAPTPQWKRVGDVKALPLPMACTLSQFTDEYRYHFIVRGVDVYNRTGQFCETVNILLSSRR